MKQEQKELLLKDFRFGTLYENKEDLPNYYEISGTRVIHLGAVKIEIKPL